jgi:hypothetical protein
MKIEEVKNVEVKNTKFKMGYLCMSVECRTTSYHFTVHLKNEVILARSGKTMQ